MPARVGVLVCRSVELRAEAEWSPWSVHGKCVNVCDHTRREKRTRSHWMRYHVHAFWPTANPRVQHDILRWMRKSVGTASLRFTCAGSVLVGSVDATGMTMTQRGTHLVCVTYPV